MYVCIYIYIHTHVLHVSTINTPRSRSNSDLWIPQSELPHELVHAEPGERAPVVEP